MMLAIVASVGLDCCVDMVPSAFNMVASMALA
jgi:hypothetical protein